MGLLKEIEKKFPEGSNLTILNTFYHKPEYDFSGKYPKMVEDDYISIIYKDLDTDKKYMDTIKNPSYIYYKLNDDQPEPTYNKLFIEKEKVHPVEVPYRDLLKNIAVETNNEEFYKFNAARGQKAENKKLHTDPSIFFSDQAIDDHYRFRFNQTYKNNIFELKRGYFDIEVDGKYTEEDFPPLGSCPINCVSFLNDGNNTIYTYILRNPDNPLVAQFEEEIKSGRFTHEDIREFVKQAVGSNKLVKKLNLDETTFKLQFYTEEIDLLCDLWKQIHECSPDFLLGWNCSQFDIPYIIERIKVLGYIPEDVMCDQTVLPKIIEHFIDERHLSELAQRGDYTFISGKTVIIDQEIQYASRRKSKIGSYKSFKLDDIGYIEADIHKLDYSHITHSVIDLPWLNFKIFVLYNIMDVIVQKAIENEAQDMDYIFAKCIMNNTCYQKGHRNTIYLVNRMAKDWYEKGYIIGNNINKWNKKDQKYLGALVHDPTHNNNYSKRKIDHRPIWIVDNLLDFD